MCAVKGAGKAILDVSGEREIEVPHPLGLL